MLKFVLKIMCFFRKFTSPIIWFFIKPFLKKPDENYWAKVKDNTLTVFNAIMGDIPYKLDPLWGILDYTYRDLSYYFYKGNWDNILLGRDCDDAATLWFEFLKPKRYIEEVYTVLCSNGWNFKQSHFFTVAKFDDGRYRLFNYTMYNTSFVTFEDACDEFKKTKLLKSGKYDKLKWCIYKTYKKEDGI